MDKCHALHTAKKSFFRDILSFLHLLSDRLINAKHVSHCRNIHADSLMIIMAAKHDNNH